MSEVGKPMGAICISPAILAAVLGSKKPTVTIGTDKQTAKALEEMGAIHQDCPVDQAVTDKARKLVTTPAYMLGPSIKDVARGIEALVAKVFELAKA
jgi:enhancing lycopene biosynthesis protein 2